MTDDSYKLNLEENPLTELFSKKRDPLLYNGNYCAIYYSISTCN